MKFPFRVVLTLAALLGPGTAVPAWSQAAAQDAQPSAPHSAQHANAEKSPEPQGIPAALPKGKKLVLTDGTFQLVREYQVEGDRVRYWSVERSAWEEIPSKMVDWDATRKAEAEQQKREADLKAKIHASEVAERLSAIDVDRSLEIKPGLFLPDGVGFYAVEGKLIFEMKQSQTDSKLSSGRTIEQILSPVPIIAAKQTLEIPGARAGIRITTAEPEFFMRPADDRQPRLRLLRAQVKGNHRVLETVSTFRGQQAHQARDVEIQTWTPARGVFRYTLNERLDPGEYAFVEMTDEGISGYVWDFGVDPPGRKPGK